jgi:hypothetical protein
MTVPAGKNDQAAAVPAAFAAAVDLSKLLLSLATGALVFSIGLVTPNGFTFTALQKSMLIVSWIFLFIAAAAGIFALGRALLLLNASTPKIDDGRLKGAVAIQELAIGGGILGVALALILALGSAPVAARPLVATPMDAVRRAQAELRAGDTLTKVANVELLHGFEGNRADEQIWHVQFEVRRGKTSATSDVYIDPVTGSSYIAESH